MKRTKICLFAFRPEHYRDMEAYLNDMAASGWRLRWCRGVLAGFVPAEEPVRFAVDPFGATALSYLRRYPRRRLQERMREGWYGVGRSKGCQILATESPDLTLSPPAGDPVSQIRAACRLASLLWVAALAALAFYLLRSPAVVYSLILTNLYLVLAVLAAFLFLYHAVNAAMLGMPPGPCSSPRLCKRYLVHTAALLILLVAAIALELGGRNDMLLYLLIPIAAIAVSIVVMQSMAGGQKDARRLFPVVAVLSAALFCTILLLNQRMSDANAAWSTQQRQTLLTQADTLPVLHLEDFGSQGEKQQAVRVNRSILADNLLYAEESESGGYVFTNRTVTRSPFLAKELFRYLYLQARTDFREDFREQAWNGGTLHILDRARTALFLEGSGVFYFTVPEGASLEDAASLLLERGA